MNPLQRDPLTFPRKAVNSLAAQQWIKYKCANGSQYTNLEVTLILFYGLLRSIFICGSFFLLVNVNINFVIVRFVIKTLPSFGGYAKWELFTKPITRINKLQI